MGRGGALDPTTWDRIQDLFMTALDLAAADRDVFLARECAGRPDMRAEIESMLACHEDGAGLQVERILLSPGAGVPADTASGQPDDRIGAWRLVRLLGRGGMGEVWLAERAEGGFEQQAAVKLVRPGWRAAEMIARFQRERQILARLVHPNISRLLDGGVTADGRPFLAMEYVDGRPITAWCDDRRLDVRARLRLVRTVCDAVTFAHASLVVHRDLKPANILVTSDGRPVLLDFGIAKLLDPADEASPGTRPEERILTPEHAAPEQLRDGAVTALTDVWALGVLLYELLAGCPPFRFGSRSSLEIERVVLSEDPRPPSSAVLETGLPDGRDPRQVTAARSASARDLSRMLRGDLDAITLKALRKEPHQRYGSVNLLSEDLDRWLSDLPVRARLESPLEKARKFMRRNRLPVAAAAAVLVILALFAGVTAWQAARMEAERDRARAEQVKAEQVVQVLVDLFNASNPLVAPGGDTLRVAEFLEAGERKIAEIAGQPEVQARLWETMALIHEVRSRYDRALENLNRALESAESARREDDVLRLFHYKGRVVHKLDGDRAARPIFLESLARHEAHLGPDHPDVAGALQDLAEVTEDIEEAGRLLARSLDIRKRHYGPESDEIASSLNALGSNAWNRQDFALADSCFREALKIIENSLPPDHPSILNVRANLAFCAGQRGRFAEAEEAHRKLEEVRRRILGAETIPVAASLDGLGQALVSQGRHGEAVGPFREALRLKRKILGPDHPSTAVSWRQLGCILALAGHTEEGMAMVDSSMVLARRLHGQASPAAAAWEAQRVRVELILGRPVLPDSMESVIHSLRDGPISYRPSLAAALVFRGIARLLADRPGDVLKAEGDFLAACSLQARCVDPGHPERTEAVIGALVARRQAGGSVDREALAESLSVYERWGLAVPSLVDRARRVVSAR